MASEGTRNNTVEAMTRLRRGLRGRGYGGSTLVFTMILLAVLSVIGAAAVMLSSQERQNAAGKSKYDALVQCAAAAEGVFWAERLRWGPNYVEQPITPAVVNLPDGTKLIAPAHYNTPLGMAVKSLVYKPVGGPTSMQGGDWTNKTMSQSSGAFGETHEFIVHCVDKAGRKYEVEVGKQLL